MIQILEAVFINFCALKVVKWATMLPAAASPVSVDPSKYGTKRSGSEEVFLTLAPVSCRNKTSRRIPKGNNEVYYTYEAPNTIKLQAISQLYCITAHHPLFETLILCAKSFASSTATRSTHF